MNSIWSLRPARRIPDARQTLFRITIDWAWDAEEFLPLIDYSV
jgi:hypothetical protein